MGRQNFRSIIDQTKHQGWIEGYRERTINTKNALIAPREKLFKIMTFHDHCSCLQKERKMFDFIFLNKSKGNKKIKAE